MRAGFKHCYLGRVLINIFALGEIRVKIILYLVPQAGRARDMG